MAGEHPRSLYQQVINSPKSDHASCRIENMSLLPSLLNWRKILQAPELAELIRMSHKFFNPPVDEEIPTSSSSSKLWNSILSVISDNISIQSGNY